MNTCDDKVHIIYFNENLIGVSGYFAFEKVVVRTLDEAENLVSQFNRGDFVSLIGEIDEDFPLPNNGWLYRECPIRGFESLDGEVKLVPVNNVYTVEYFRPVNGNVGECCSPVDLHYNCNAECRCKHANMRYTMFGFICNEGVTNGCWE